MSIRFTKWQWFIVAVIVCAFVVMLWMQYWRPEPLIVQWQGTALVRVLAYSPTGNVLAVAYSDNQVELREGTTGHLITILRNPDSTISDAFPQVAFSPDGAVLVATTRNGVDRWCIQDACPLVHIPVWFGHPIALAFQEDSTTFVLVTSSLDVLTCRGITENTCTYSRFEQRRYSYLVLSGDGRLAGLSGFTDDTIDIRTIPDGQLVGSVSRKHTSISPRSLQGDGRILVAMQQPSEEGALPYLLVWDMMSNRLLARIPNAARWILAVSPNQQYVVGGRSNPLFDDGVLEPVGNVWIWQVTTGVVVDGLWPGSRNISSITLSPDSRHLAVAGDNEVRIWDMSVYQ